MIKNRLFGTDGVRGVVNEELTPELAYNLGKAAAHILKKDSKKPTFIIGKDTRLSGDLLSMSLSAGLLASGANVIDVDVIPTPAIAHLVRKYKATAGVMISASHNPYEYNGIKFFDGRGYKLSDELEDQIQAVIESNFEGVPSPVGGAVGRSYTEETALREYIDYAMSTIKTDLKGLRVALDCANGAAYKAAVKAFRALGARVYVINDNPDGNNINENCGSTHMEELMDYVVRKNCDIGFAFDGDADRCLAVDEKGNMINGDFLLTICAKALKESGRLKDDTLVVTVMSNLGLDIAAKREGINLVKTKVGDRYVLEEMLKENYILGGEQSGHIIFLHHNTTGDGLVTALQIAAILKESGKTFSELAGVMKELPQVLVNAKVPNEKKNIYLEDKEIIDAINAVESKLNGVGRVLIRPSGTEPLVRVMLEGENQEEINAMANSLVDLILSKI